MNKLFKYIIFIIFTLFFANGVTLAIEDNSAEITKDTSKTEQKTDKINLQDILNKAKEHSYDLKIADYNFLISKQSIRGARSEYFPKLMVSA